MKLTAKEFLILGMSSSPDGISGKTLAKQIEQRNVKAWTEIGISSVYYVLDRLQEKGLLETFQHSEQPQRPGAPEKKLILKDTGRMILAETVREYLNRDSLKFREINLVLVAAHSLPEEELKDLFQQYRERLSERISFIKSKYEQDSVEGMGLQGWAVFQHSLHVLNAELAFLDEFIRRLGSEEIELIV